MAKLKHSDVQYGKGHPQGDHCGACRYWDDPHCLKVKDPMTFGSLGWCNRFMRKNRPASAAHQSKIQDATS